MSFELKWLCVETYQCIYQQLPATVFKQGKLTASFNILIQISTVMGICYQMGSMDCLWNYIYAYINNYGQVSSYWVN